VIASIGMTHQLEEKKERRHKERKSLNVRKRIKRKKNI